MLAWLAAAAGAVLAAVFWIASPGQEAPAAAVPTGDLVYRQGTHALRLTDAPCEFEEIDADLTERGIPPVKAYLTLQRDGRWSMSGCWARTMGSEVLTRDTAGADGYIPADWFKREGQAVPRP